MSSQPCVCKGYIFNLFWWVELIGSDTCIDTCIMAKIDAIWLTFVSYGPVVTLKIQSKVQKLQI